MQKYTKEEKQILTPLGNKIRSIRTVKGFTQSHVAALCDSQKAHYCRVERGKVNPTIITIQKIALVLQVPITELLSFEY